jgi:hypothetical protein
MRGGKGDGRPAGKSRKNCDSGFRNDPRTRAGRGDPQIGIPHRDIQMDWPGLLFHLFFNVSESLVPYKLLRIAASVEAGFNHPIANAIIAHASTNGVRPLKAERSDWPPLEF